MRILLFFTTFLIGALQLPAATITINGNSNTPATVLRILIADDLVSGRYTLLAQTNTDFKGAFSLQAQIQSISFARIAAGADYTDILLTPGATYHIQIHKTKTDYTSFYDAPAITVDILQADDQGVYQAIEKINLIYNAFVLEHFQSLYRLKQAAYLDSLHMILNKQVNVSHPFVEQYLFYKLASLEPVVKNMTTSQVFEKYFLHRPILYDNPEYISLFKEFFGSYYTEHRLIGHARFLEAIAQGDNNLRQLMATDPLISSYPAFGELILLYQLQSFFSHPQLSPKVVEERLLQIANTSTIYKHRIIARNIIFMQSYLAFGAPAFDFQLLDQSGKLYELSQDSSSVVILNFIRENCPLCEYELQDLQQLSAKYATQLKVVSISVRESYPYYSRLFHQNRYHWKLLNLNQQYEILDTYQVRFFPYNIILLPSTRIGQCPAPTQYLELENQLKRLVPEWTTSP
ncbi:MAG: TlpA family protein disulfide reductase [Bacteroidales bacterium]|nr:TlpA family protein disulfide reductase [Bacteroidales bacterium]